MKVKRFGGILGKCIYAYQAFKNGIAVKKQQYGKDLENGELQKRIYRLYGREQGVEVWRFYIEERA